MGLIVQKFGGSSVANAERVNNVAKIVTDTYAQGNNVVVVVSAQGDTTDDLIEKAKEINPKGGSKREMDMLLTAGEQISGVYGSVALKAKWNIKTYTVNWVNWNLFLEPHLTVGETGKLSLAL